MRSIKFNDRIAIAATVVSVVAIAAALFTPEVRCRLGIEKCRSSYIFRCNSIGGFDCYFSVDRAPESGRVTYVIPSQRSLAIDGIVPGSTRYCVCVGSSPPEDWSECKTPHNGAFCTVRTANAKENI